MEGGGLSVTHLELEETDQKILDLLFRGLSDAVIARRLGLGHRTVQRRVGNLMRRLSVSGRVALGAKAQELGLFCNKPGC
ncbi:response regulator transcription factor [Streptomyces sp. VMFN-G11Ma]|uniref:response regulator transcription factor n=1 Tax=Streptomyces sp. VMFN-G11Ma TaxID=2135609 RepID=UPI000D393915|nr:helix-turn-helix transcriptional regulator [Streptomyces sp. VMFN-G11Ma]